MEILCKISEVIVNKPFRARCGHEITNCPTCNKPISNFVNGETIKRFLIEKLGINENDAKDLWRMRQLFHGANHLTQRATQDLPRLLIILQHASLNALKLELGIGEQGYPVSTTDAPRIHPESFLGGEREITDSDV